MSDTETEVTTVTEQTTTQADPQKDENLLSALKKEREAKNLLEKQLKAQADREKELQKKLDAVKSIDPDQYEKLKALQAEQQEKDLLNRKEFARAKEQYQVEAETARKTAAELKNQLNSVITRTAIERAFFEAGGKKSSFDLSVQSPEDITPVEMVLSVLQNRIRLEEDGKIVFLNAIGNIEVNSEGKPKSIGEKIAELKKGSTGALFEPENTNSGTGAAPTTTSYGGKQVTVYSIEQARNGRADIDAIASGKAIISR